VADRLRELHGLLEQGLINSSRIRSAPGGDPRGYLSAVLEDAMHLRPEELTAIIFEAAEVAKGLEP
jgi:hypothetical protein